MVGMIIFFLTHIEVHHHPDGLLFSNRSPQIYIIWFSPTSALDIHMHSYLEHF